MITVTLDLYSGRANPSFVLQEQEEDAVLQWLAQLPETSGQFPIPDQLGYRGLCLEGAPSPWAPRIIVHQGRVYSALNAMQVSLTTYDGKRGMERRLLHLALSKFSGEWAMVVEQLLAEMEKEGTGV
ncbi:hypothetical protein SIID45300_00086 [Candidatus Magnetaquicoccaceae bacterium FCR-1]|uniref:Uncharacterized protein n=1 Tax=Candidatus Magnetaquiglobus chichijimensis TaxID=3141448 RepID=A0ABQ0C503_9PROT